MSFPFFFFTLVPLLFHSSHCTTILVDGSSELKNPNVHIGDSITQATLQCLHFQEPESAFDLCNFTQATLLTNANTASYTWHPSRPGFFYFSFNDWSIKACQTSQKLVFKVTSVAAATPHASAVPPELSPLADGAPFCEEVSPSPLIPWHFDPQNAASPGPSPSESVMAPLMVPYKSGSMPFITSNPAVPLPSDEIDSAAIHPIPTSTGHHRQVMIGSFGLLIAMLTIILLLL